MKLTVVGSGYVGLPTSSAFAELGNEVICVDKDQKKIADLQNGKITLYEPDLEELVQKNQTNGKLTFTTDLKSAVESTDIIMVAVGTMPDEKTGNADLSHVENAIKDIALSLNSNDYKIIVIKSTVRVGTNNKLIKIIKQVNPEANFDIISIPEFLREGKAVYDFFNPERIVIGFENHKALEVIKRLYAPFLDKKVPILFCSLNSAEMIKYAANSFLGVKISFINELSDLCEKLGANIKDVAEGIGLDSRIGSKFLKPSPGFGGSCLPKDMLEIKTTARSVNSPLTVVEAALDYNNQRSHILVKKIQNVLEDINQKSIGILGLAFKAETDDIRKSPTIDIIKILINQGAIIKAFDPKAMDNSKHVLPNITYANNVYDAAENTDALIILTEWKEFTNLDFDKLNKIMKNKIIFDFRNLLNQDNVLNKGFKYVSIGSVS
ncbi:UDP-glucose dehydrogenase family protein [Rickettsiales bacterium LUAb2]